MKQAAILFRISHRLLMARIVVLGRGVEDLQEAAGSIGRCVGLRLQSVKIGQWVPDQIASHTDTGGCYEIADYSNDELSACQRFSVSKYLCSVERWVLLPTLDNGNPTRFPKITSFGFLAYLWKSAALEAKVAQFAAPRRKKRISSHVLFEPVAVPGWRATSPIPPALLKVHAHMAIAEIMKTISFA